MAILDIFRPAKALKNEVERLTARVQADSIILDKIVTWATVSQTAQGNQYLTPSAQTKALSDKYKGAAAWGCQVARNVVAVRASFSVGGGFRPIALESGAEKELAAVEKILRFNHIDTISQAVEWGREAEIEGKVLFALTPDPQTKNVKIRFIPWTTFSYKIKTDPEDYTVYNTAEYHVAGKPVVLPAPRFTFGRFAGRPADVDESPPYCGVVLMNMEYLDKAVYDYRKINNLFAAPTPYFKTEDRQTAEDFRALLAGMYWNVGKALVGSADFKMVGITEAGADSLMKEIEANAKIISGATGVPVHFLGLPDLLSNRAVAENLMELVLSSTVSARAVWLGVYTELLRKALTLYAEANRLALDPLKIGVDIPVMSTSRVQELADVWLPLYTAHAISLDTLLSKIPEVDADKEKARIETELDAVDARTRANAPDFGSVGPDNPSGGNGAGDKKRLTSARPSG